MLATSRVLATLIEHYFRAASDENRDCRILVPGLTRRIASEIHRRLLQQGINSFLVVGEEDEPNEASRLIRAIGLTSKRIGSFVAVANPGQLVHIQDSIRGSGGTIRSLAFSEEWPWIDDGSEPFRFDGPVLNSLVAEWSGNHVEQEWLRQFTLNGLLEYSRPSSRRGQLLLESILGTFNANDYPAIADVKQKFLFHSGVPRPSGAVPTVPRLIKDTARLCQRIVDRCQKDEDVREQAREIVLEVIPEDERNDVMTSLDRFMDRLGRSSTIDLGLLALHGCWGENRVDSSDWYRLDAGRLERLFRVEPRERAEVTYRISCQRGLLAGDGKRMATFLGEHIEVDIDFRIPVQQFAEGPWIAAIYCRQRRVTECELPGNEGRVCMRFSSDDLGGRYARKMPIRIALVLNNDIQADERLEVNLCGPDRPAFSIVEPGFEVTDAYAERNEEAPDRKIIVEDPVHVYLISEEANDVRLSKDGNEDLSIIETEAPGIWRSAQRLDVSNEPGGQINVECIFGTLSSTFSLEVGDLEKGEFTIEDELRVLLAGPRERRLSDLFGIFEGTKREPYPALGKMDAASNLRKSLARILDQRDGWRPLLTDLLVTRGYVTSSPGDFISCLGPIDGGAFATLDLPTGARALLADYSNAREAIIREVESELDMGATHTEHPLYASHPIFVNSRSVQMELLLSAYLAAFHAILAYIDGEKSNLEWGQVFVLTHLDCVVHWDNSRLRDSFYLVGPWHPLVLAKRFMVQAALYERANRLLHGEDGKHLRHLALLLGKIQGFRWLVGLSADDRQVEPTLATMTSDPGWHLAIKMNCDALATQEEAGGISGILRRVQERLGLAVDIGTGATEDLAIMGLSAYVRSFPSRRSVGVRIRGGYSVDEIVTNVDAFLHCEAGPTSHGKQLPGGVRLYVEDKLGADVSAQWSNPPLCICRFEDDDECIRNAQPDIYMLPPTREPSFSADTGNHSIPRGIGRQAVFYRASRWLTEGQSLVPKSVSTEFDALRASGDGIGGAFTGTLSQIRQTLGTTIATISSIDLPQRLVAPWVIVPGQSIDPAVLVKYVRDGADRALQERTLWDYKLDLAGRANSFYVLSTIPRGFLVAVNGFFGSQDIAGEFIVDLGKIGIAIGGEALKTGRHALGIIGLVGAVRMLVSQGRDGRIPLSSGQGIVSFLIPVDSFASFFGRNTLDDGRRTDLLAICIVLPRAGSQRIRISACGIESKFVSGTLGIPRAHAALAQCLATVTDFKKLIAISLREGAMPERLALLELIEFGLRIAGPSRPSEIEQWVDISRSVQAALLAGEYEFVDARHGAVLVSTEGQLPGVSEAINLQEGLWLRLTKTHWPGVAETLQLQETRTALYSLFDMPGIGTAPLPEGPSAAVPETGDEGHGPEPESGTGQTEPDILPVPPIEEPGLSEPYETVENRPARPLEKIFIGVDDSRRMVYYDPQSPLDPLDNMNIMITGSSGKGKTQLVKYLVCRFREQGKNLLILDFKNDFASDVTFTRDADLERVFVTFEGLPYNPLIPYPIRHPATGELYLQPNHHIAGVVSVLKRTYRLGDQQAAILKNAISSAFEAAGILSAGTVRYLDNSRFPDFSIVGSTLQREDIRAFNRLEPLFSLGLFRPEFRTISFHELTARSLAIDLSQLQSDEVKNTISQLVVMSAHNYFNSLPHSGLIRQLFVIDEANRVLDYEYMADFVLQCRAYGVGIILSSQYPSQYPQDVSSSMATKIIHGNERDINRIRAIVQLIRCDGREGDVASLERFQAFIDNRHYPHTLIRTFNYPLHLVWSKLNQCGTATLEELSRLDGVDVNKLPIENLVRALERLGLAEEREGQIRAIRHG